MVEQELNNINQNPTLAETSDPQGFADRKGGLFTSAKKTISRRVLTPAAIILGLSGLAGCGNEKPTTSESSGPTTAITQTTTSENLTTSGSIPDTDTTGTTLGETTTTREKILYSDLVDLKNIAPYNTPEELKKAVEEKTNGTIRNPKLFEASDIDLKQKISFYLFNVNNDSFVSFQKNGQYVVEKYKMKTYSDTERSQSHVVFASDTGYFLDFYLNKIIPENSNINPDDIFKEVSEVVVSDLHQNKKINFTSNEKGAIDKIIRVLSPAARYKEQLVSENTTTTIEMSADEKRSELEKRMGSILLTENVSMEDIIGHSKFDKFSRIPSALENVPPEIQEQFKKNNPNHKVLWVGNGNRNGELNALITTMPIKPDNYSGVTFQADGFGYYRGLEDPNFIITREEFAGAKVIGASVYLKFLNRVTGKYTYSELNLNKKDGNCTGANIINLENNFNNPVFEFTGKKYRLFYLLENGYSLDEFLQIGDVVGVLHLGQNDQGILKIRGIDISGSAERYNKIKQVFDSLPE